MTYGGLFEGIGGFILASKWAGVTPIWSNEIDPWCCKALRTNFNHKIIEDDIRNCGIGRKHELEFVNLICGGFPCQPVSLSGLRKGTIDSRYLWEEMFRIAKENQELSNGREHWFIAENVTGIVTMEVAGAPEELFPVLEGKTIVRYENYDIYEAIYTQQTKMLLESICQDLESIGYQVAPIIIPASSVEAWHERKRIWIVANANGDRKTEPIENASQQKEGRRTSVKNGRGKHASIRRRGLLDLSQLFAGSTRERVQALTDFT